ncbi:MULTISPECIES: hypothetical protein [unclassified Nitrosospira]|uniref:hypothetical protein n=1 Tax=unclassified Nitrosospira TaxID=2609267 RepID=UPI00210E65F2|nr:MULTISPECIES: hypothetical protein [unclassified Nitrosospira]
MSGIFTLCTPQTQESTKRTLTSLASVKSIVAWLICPPVYWTWQPVDDPLALAHA